MGIVRITDDGTGTIDKRNVFVEFSDGYTFRVQGVDPYESKWKLLYAVLKERYGEDVGEMEVTRR